MGIRKRRAVEWLLLKLDVVAVLAAMSWGLLWVMTHRRLDAPGRRRR